MDLGLEWAGMTCRWQVEIDQYARRVLAKHWPDVPRWDDVRTFPPDVADADRGRLEELKERDRETAEDPTNGDSRGIYVGRCRNAGEWDVDLICGGFPCQDISFAGKGAGLAGERSGLWYEFARVVRVVRPRYVLVENVAALLVRGLDAVLGTLASLGYDADWACIPAAAVGAPHIRDRVFIAAHRNGDECTACLRSGDVQWSVREKEGRPKASNRPSDCRDREVTLAYANGTRPQGRVFDRFSTSEWAAGSSVRSVPGTWLTEPAVGRVAHGIPGRVDRLRGLGNAVVPQVAEYIGRRILDHAGN
jgi:DNA (cytosine-5)-methyltransferase 1